MNAALLLPQEVVATPLPNFLRGYADDPNLAAWLALPPGGLSTPAQRNAIVAQLAWAQSVLARPPADVPLVRGIGFPFGVTEDGRSLVLGAVDYVPGDIRAPGYVSPAGALPAEPTPPTPPLPVPVPEPPRITTVVVTDAQRRAAFDAAGALLYALRLRPGSLVLAPPTHAPAGFIQALVGLAVVGLAGYAAYTAYIETAAIDARARVEQTRIQEEQRALALRATVRIQEEANTQRVTAQIQGKLAALAERMSVLKTTGRLPPESSLEREPIQVQAQQQLGWWNSQAKKDPTDSGWSTAALAAGVVAGGLLVGAGTTAWGRREDISAAYGEWRARRAAGRAPEGA